MLAYLVNGIKRKAVLHLKIHPLSVILLNLVPITKCSTQNRKAKTKVYTGACETNIEAIKSLKSYLAIYTTFLQNAKCRTSYKLAEPKEQFRRGKDESL